MGQARQDREPALIPTVRSAWKHFWDGAMRSGSDLPYKPLYERHMRIAFMAGVAWMAARQRHLNQEALDHVSSMLEERKAK